MVKTDVKKKKKKSDSGRSLSHYYGKLKTYGIPALVLLLAYIGFRIRDVTSNYKTFLDPDTFYHFELYKIAIKEGIPKYLAYANPPTGITLKGGYLGLYVVQAWFYKITHALFGTTVMGAFKLWPPFVGAMTIIAVYLLGRKLHSDWAGLWAAAFMSFSYANFSKTFSGNNRGEGPFMMFFLYTMVTFLLYIEEGKWNWKKILWGALFLLLSPLYMGVWNGSQFGVGILLALLAVYPVVLFTFGKMEELKQFVRDSYPLYGVSLLIGLGLSLGGFVGIKGFLIFALEAFAALLVLVAVMFLGEKVGLNYSDRKHRFGTVVVVVILGFAAAYAYFGRDLWKFFGAAYQSNPLYQTVAELAKTNLGTIKSYYSVKSKDALVFLLSLAGFAIVLARLVTKLAKADVSGYKEIFLVTYYSASLYLLYLSVRFVFQASGALLLLAGVAVGEAFLFVENMRESINTKALYAIFLILLFVPIPVVGARYSSDIAHAYSKSQGSVPGDWVNTLEWLKNNSNPLDSATSWWDYGYWIESSLLSHRRAITDGGHAYDRRYLVAKFFTHYWNESEVDFEAWELNYIITYMNPLYQGSDFYKFNAISYLGGAINYGEYHDLGMLYAIGRKYIHYANESGRQIVYIDTPNGAAQPIMTIDMTTGRVIHGRGDMPYVLYIFQNYGVLAYRKIAFSNYVRLAFRIPFSLEPWDAQKLYANFMPVHSTFSVMVYKFRPFAVYRIDRLENGTWKAFYSTLGGGKLPLGNQTLRLWISAFGRDIKDATLVFEAYNGTKLVDRKTLVKGLYINHLNETPVTVNLYVPNATKYRFVLYQAGPVGVLTSAPKVNGKIADPSYVLPEGKSGTLELKAAFRRDYTANLTLRASIVYYVAPNGKDIYKKDFYLEPHMDIIEYVPVKGDLNLREGNNTITAKASMPSGVFEKFIEGLYQKYGRDKVVVVRKRIEPIFIARKEYVIWEGG
jgi:dolichyl-diphosphooligosaccharide--protein glycosyltransferase